MKLKLIELKSLLLPHEILEKMATFMLALKSQYNKEKLRGSPIQWSFAQSLLNIVTMACTRCIKPLKILTINYVEVKLVWQISNAASSCKIFCTDFQKKVLVHSIQPFSR